MKCSVAFYGDKAQKLAHELGLVGPAPVTVKGTAEFTLHYQEGSPVVKFAFVSDDDTLTEEILAGIKEIGCKTQKIANYSLWDTTYYNGGQSMTNCSHSSGCKKYWLKKCHGTCPNQKTVRLSKFITAYQKAVVRLKSPLRNRGAKA